MEVQLDHDLHEDDRGGHKEYTFPWLSLTSGMRRFGTKAGAFSMTKWQRITVSQTSPGLRDKPEGERLPTPSGHSQLAAVIEMRKAAAGPWTLGRTRTRKKSFWRSSTVSYMSWLKSRQGSYATSTPRSSRPSSSGTTSKDRGSKVRNSLQRRQRWNKPRARTNARRRRAPGSSSHRRRHWNGRHPPPACVGSSSWLVPALSVLRGILHLAAPVLGGTSSSA